MPYLMGGFPTVDDSIRVGTAYADAGADLIELGVPFSDPLADGPVIHAAATRALAERRDRARGLAGRRADRRARPGRAHVLRQPDLRARRAERFAAQLAERGISGLIVPDLPLEESAAGAGRVRCARDRARPAVAPTTPDDRLAAIGRTARGFVYTVSVTGTTGERTAGGGDAATLLARVKAHSSVPVALGFGIATGAHAAAAADAGADGVIVGSRLVRAVAEAAEQGADRPPPRVRWSRN